MRMINESPIVKRLFDLIQERGVTPKKVTEDTGISSTSFTDWKKGKGNPSVYALTRLASYFEVSLDYLINGQEYAGKTRESTVAKILEVIVGKRVDKYKKRINQIRTTIPVSYDS